MKKIIPVVVAVALVASLLAASCAPEREEEPTPSSITIVDSAGRVVEVPQPLNKVIVVYSHLMLAMKALSIGDEVIVGLDEFTLGQYEEIFPGLSGKPTAGRNLLNLDAEKIITLEPQVMIATPTTIKRLPELEAELELVGIKVVALDFKLENVQEVIHTLGKMFGKEKEAEEFADFWFSKLDIVRERVEEIKDEERVRVYWENTMTAYKTISKGATPHELLEMAGGLNIAQDLIGNYPEVDPEWVIVEDPEVILKYPMGADYQGGFGKTDTEPFEEMRREIMERPGFDQIKAVKEGEVYILSQIIKGGAFENVGICYIAKLLYPELFEDLDPEAHLEEMAEKYLGLNFEEVKGVFIYPESVTIVDSAGRTVEVPQPLERIAVWNSATAEVIRALGAKDKICAIDEYTARKDYYWPELKDRPQIGNPYKEIDYEKIIELDPQVLITSPKYPKGTELEERLEPVGIKVVRLECYHVDVLPTSIRIMGVMLSKEKEAEDFANFLQSKLDLIEERVKEIKPEERKKVYWEDGKKDYYTNGSGSSVHKLLCTVGAINIFADLEVVGSAVDPEAILVREPDVVIKGAHGSIIGGYLATDTSEMEQKLDEMMNRAGWSELNAVKNGQVYILGKDLTGGVKDPIRLCYFAKLLYPDRFEDLDIEAFHKEYLEKYQGLEFKGVYVYPKPF